MSAVHSKTRSELSLDQVFASMLVVFNGKSYKDYEEMNRDSTELGKKWWGYVDRKGDRFKV
jgi:hypothetical protein